MREKFLRLFCSNVRGLICNWEVATSFDWSIYDVVAFNEVWDIKNFEQLKVDNFTVLTQKIRLHSRGGGSIIFGKKDLNYEVLNTPFIEGTIETTGIKMDGIIFINVY